MKEIHSLADKPPTNQPLNTHQNMVVRSGIPCSGNSGSYPRSSSGRLTQRRQHCRVYRRQLDRTGSWSGGGYTSRAPGSSHWLPSYHTVYAAELRGIEMALTQIRDTGKLASQRSYQAYMAIVFTDNQAAIQVHSAPGRSSGQQG